MPARARYLLVFALSSLACGRAQPASAPERAETEHDAEQAPAPAAEAPAAAPAEQEFAREEGRSLESELEEFERARLELSQVLGRNLEAPADEAPSSAREDGAAAGSPPPPPPAPARRRAEADQREAGKPKALKKGEDSCVTVCRAFGSLLRSAAAVCRLDGHTERCRRANGIVAVAEADPGVKTCGCQR